MLIADQSYSYSIDGEHYVGEYNTKEDVIKAALMEGEEFSIGENYKFVPSLPDASDIIADITYEAEDDSGGVVDDYLNDVTAEEIQLLDKMMREAFNNWLKQTNHEPNFFIAEEI